MNHVLKKHTSTLILIGVWLTSLVGIQSVPLEKHEAFVLETAQEIQCSGEWVVPRFNDRLRLQKPPFSYWATLIVSELDPLHHDIQIWHGRLVSLLASLLIALVVSYAGTRFYGSQAGLMAPILLLSMQGFIHLSYNGRPDLLYAAFCTLQLFAWMAAWKAADQSRQQRWAAWLGWGACALATLTKGPQMPVVFLAGILIFLAFNAEKKRICCILRPLSGILLFCAITLPWWIILNQRLQAAGINIEKSQLSGSLLRNTANWKEILSGYYLWTLFALMLPVSLLIPFRARQLWKNKTIKNSATRLLLTAAIAMLIVFTAGGHYRKHYLLPIIPIAALFLAQPICKNQLREIGRKWKIFWFSITISTVSSCGVLLLIQKAYLPFILLLLDGYLLFLLLRNTLEESEWKKNPFARQIFILCILTSASISGYNALLPFNEIRAAKQSLAEKTYQLIQPNDILVEWKSSTEVLPYFTKRNVKSFQDIEKMKSFLEPHYAKTSIFAVLPTEDLETFGNFFEIHALEKTEFKHHPSKNLTLVKILKEQTSDTSVNL